MTWAEEQAQVLRTQLRRGLPPRIAVLGVDVHGDGDEARVVARLRHQAVGPVVAIDFPVRDETGEPVSLDHEWRLWQLDELFDAKTIKRLGAAEPDGEGMVWREFEDL